MAKDTGKARARLGIAREYIYRAFQEPMGDEHGFTEFQLDMAILTLLRALKDVDGRLCDDTVELANELARNRTP